MKKYLLILTSLVSLSNANMIQHMTFCEWDRSEKVAFTHKCLSSKSIKQLEVYKSQMKCYIKAKKLAKLYPDYQKLSQLDTQKFDTILSN